MEIGVYALGCPSGGAVELTCFNPLLIPNIVEDTRSRKRTKRGRKRLFNPDVYKRRFSSECTIA